MPKNVLRLAMMTFLFSAGALLAQSDAPPSSTPPSRQEPCWRQAGISHSIMEQHQTIERDAHSQVAAVCENSSLTAQQKQQQVMEIHRQAQQKLDALITPGQQSTLHACQKQRRGNSPGHESHHPGGANPCGNFASSQGRQGPTNGNTSGNAQSPEN
jgi:hypothetical protein